MEENEKKVHLRHCYQGEYDTSCKYGDDENCPAKKNKKTDSPRSKKKFTQEEVVTRMYELYPDEGSIEERTINMYHRIGFLRCYDFLSGKDEVEEVERLKILKQIQNTFAVNQLANEMFSDSKPLEGKPLEVLKETAKKCLSKTPTTLFEKWFKNK